MNINISGCGQVAPGEYESIRISGSGKLLGLVRCNYFSGAGSSRGEELECSGPVKVSGSSKFTKTVQAQTLSVAGSLTCGGDLSVEEELKCSGSMECSGNIKCGTLKITGAAEADSGVEAETVTVSGTLDCEGLLNGEDIQISGGGMRIGSIGGSNITIRRGKAIRALARIPILSTVFKSAGSKVSVPGGIEGDVIELENVKTPVVSGRIVIIGEDCDIGLVQYSETISIDANARVERTEQV